MRRLASLSVGLAILLGAAACGGPTIVSPTAKKVVGPLPKAGKGNAADGKKLYTSLGCQGCHSLAGSKGVGPTFKGLAGSQVSLDNGQTVTADDAYLIKAIEDPDAEIVAGYQKGIMSATIKPGQVSQTDAASLVAFIKTVK